ncbi:28068_t:CDS:2, partial [Racocetra persica]
ICEPSISETVNTSIYVAPRSKIKELSLVRDQLIAKFGKKFALNAIENKHIIYNVNWKLDPSVEDSFLGSSPILIVLSCPQRPDNEKNDKLGRPPSPLLSQDLSQNNYVLTN